MHCHSPLDVRGLTAPAAITQWSARGNEQGPGMAAAPQPTAPVIVAANASKLFLDGAVTAFRQLDLEVRDRETLCIVGPSGCGKTTLLRCIAGLTDLSGGKLVLGGAPVKGPPQGVAMVFQHFGLLPWKTVYANAAFGLTLASAPAAAIRDRIAHYLDLVGLSGFDH